MSNTRFALRNFAGDPTAFFRVEPETLDTSSAKATSQPSHHIIGIDVSGSMYYDLEALKGMVEKLLTLEEFRDPNLRVSLITYSSSGDVRVHFERASVADVMAPGSKQLQEIRNLRVRGLTCISQGLRAAEKLVDDKETTCISLHSDGYANDSSPMAERRDIAAAVDALKQHPNCFVNTVAYRDWSDFGMLSGIANALSGTCLQARDIHQVYDAMHDTTELLAGNMAPVLEVGVGKADFLLVLSKSGEKVLGSTEPLAVRGLSAGDDATAFRLYSMTKDEYETSELPQVSVDTDGGDVILAFARAQVALGNLNAAKYALVAYRDADLLEGHYKALTGSAVASMAGAMEKALFTQNRTVRTTTGFGLSAQGPSVLAVLGTLATYRNGIRVNVDDLVKGYQRRGLKRIPGVRNDDGSLTPPNATLKTAKDRSALPVSGIEINRNTATCNIRMVQDGTLIDQRPGREDQVIAEVEGVPLSLKDYRNYTMVSDGDLNVTVLPLRITDKRCFKALADLGMVTGTFDPNRQYDLDLSSLPLVDFGQSFDLPGDTFDRLLRLTVLQKLLSGITAGTSEALTAEQIAALKDVHVTPAGYFSPPTTNAYTDLKDALDKGMVDTRLSYKVDIGSPQITNLGKLHSGNAFLDRRFTVTDADGNEVKKPKLPALLDDGMTVAVKALSARTKLDAVDEVMYPVFAEFLNLEDNGHLLAVLGEAGLDYDEKKAFDQARIGKVDRDTRVETFTATLRKVNEAIDGIYDQTVSPLVFYVGATGLVPDEFGAKAMTAEQVVEKFPDLKLAKAEKEEGTFFLLPSGLLLTVYVKGEHFTTDAGLKAAAA